MQDATADATDDCTSSARTLSCAAALLTKQVRGAVAHGHIGRLHRLLEHAHQTGVLLDLGALLFELIVLPSMRAPTLAAFHYAGLKLDWSDPHGTSFFTRLVNAHSAETHRVAAALYLARHGASLSRADERGLTPVHHAAWHKSTVLLWLYIRLGADACGPDPLGATPLHWALQYAASLDPPTLWCVEKLVACGARLDTPDSKGQTPLEWLEKLHAPAGWRADLIAGRVPCMN